MTPEWILAGAAILQLIGLIIFALFMSKAKNELLIEMSKMRDWVDGEFVRKETCKATHFNDMTMAHGAD